MNWTERFYTRRKEIESWLDSRGLEWNAAGLGYQLTLPNCGRAYITYNAVEYAIDHPKEGLLIIFQIADRLIEKCRAGDLMLKKWM